MDKIIDRIQKLLRLAESPNVNEAANALGKAQKLMEAHRISTLMLEDQTEAPNEDPESSVLFSAGKLARWKTSLAKAVAEANGCKVYIQGRNLMTVGKPSDLDVHARMFHWIASQVDAMGKEYATGRGKTAGNNFRLGVVVTIQKRLQQAQRDARQEAREALEGDAVALVRVESAIARLDSALAEVDKWMQENLRLQTKTARSHIRGDHNAFTAGQAAGQRVSLKARGVLK